MRDPGIEPLVMISGDVMELHHLISAERAAHAAEVAEVARLRAALANHRHTDACRNYAAEKRHAYCITECRDSYAALAAPPPAAAQAVEGMRRALEAVPHERYCESMKRANVPEEICTCLPMSSRKMARSALAAWKEATRG